MRAFKRFSSLWLLQTAVVGAVTACDPMIGSGISVSPSPGVDSTSLESRVLWTAESVARRHSLRREVDFAHVENNGWKECFHGGQLRLCGKASGNTTQLLLTEFPSFHFSPLAESIRRELADSLRVRFDSQRVRECEWNGRTGTCKAQPASGTTTFRLEGNRVYVLLDFLVPDGTTHPAYAYVDMGASDMALAGPLYDSLGVNKDTPARFKVGDYIVAVPSSSIQRGGRPAVRGSGPQLEGSLPASVLAAHTLVLDYARKTLTLADPGVVRPRGTPVPFRLDTATGLIVVDATIGGENYPITIDNGSAYTWLRQGTVRQWLRGHPEWQRGVGAVGTANMMLRGEEPEREGILIRIPELSIGAVRLTDVGALGVAGGRGADTTLALMDWYSKKNAVSVLGWLGGSVLKEFQITVDYPRRTIYWLRESAADTAELHQIGLTLRTASGAVYVAGVATKNGKPTVDGVQPGDNLISVGGYDLVSGTIGQIFESMHGVPGEARQLVLERDGARFTVRATITAF